MLSSVCVCVLSFIRSSSVTYNGPFSAHEVIQPFISTSWQSRRYHDVMCRDVGTLCIFKHNAVCSVAEPTVQQCKHIVFDQMHRKLLHPMSRVNVSHVLPRDHECVCPYINSPVGRSVTYNDPFSASRSHSATRVHLLAFLLLSQYDTLASGWEVGTACIF